MIVQNLRVTVGKNARLNGKPVIRKYDGYWSISVTHDPYTILQVRRVVTGNLEAQFSEMSGLSLISFDPVG